MPLRSEFYSQQDSRLHCLFYPIGNGLPSSEHLSMEGVPPDDTPVFFPGVLNYLV